MNLGQYVQEIERITKKEVIPLNKTTGAVFSSQEIFDAIARVT
jgi:hypothetical protein